MRTVGVLVNQDKPSADDTKQRLCHLLSQHGFHQVTATTDELASDTVTGAAFEGTELIFVLGGDGTLLGAARKLVDFKIPLLGINLGHLGFLSEADPGNLQETVRRVVDREYDLEQRLVLSTSVHGKNGDTGPSFIGINDVAIGKGSFARMVTVEVYVDDVLLDSYRGDGVLVSTPTGSTAYSLSCGGPIVVPYAKAILITPICPHTLVSRPCVIDSGQMIRLVVRSPQEDVGLTVDGQIGFPLAPGDEVTVARSPVDVTLVKWRDREFFSVLRKKLRYGEQSV